MARHNFDDDITNRILPFIKEMSLENGRIKTGLLRELEEEFDLYSVPRDKATLSRLLRGQGFADNFKDPTKRVIITIFFSLYRNPKYVEECAKLFLPLPVPGRFEQWELLIEKAEELAAYKFPRNEGFRKYFGRELRRAIFEALLCYRHARVSSSMAWDSWLVKRAEGI